MTKTMNVEDMTFKQVVETVKTTNDKQVLKDILTAHNIMFDVVDLAMELTDFTLVSEDINDTEERAVSYLVNSADIKTLKAHMVEELEDNEIYY